MVGNENPFQVSEQGHSDNRPSRTSPPGVLALFEGRTSTTSPRTGRFACFWRVIDYRIAIPHFTHTDDREPVGMLRRRICSLNSSGMLE
jgi:hypothetical protein